MCPNKLQQIGRLETYKAIGRVSFYTIMLFVVLWADGILEIATQVSAISMFVIIATVFEMLQGRHIIKSYRYAIYLAALSGILVSGVFLVKAANTVKAHDSCRTHYEIVKEEK